MSSPASQKKNPGNRVIELIFFFSLLFSQLANIGRRKKNEIWKGFINYFLFTKAMEEMDHLAVTAVTAHPFGRQTAEQETVP